MNVEEYIEHLGHKGFSFGNDAQGFIYFGKELTGASDALVNAAIEITLKAQICFDGSFYISLLEALKQHNITSRKQALQFAKRTKLLV
ncbi:MAG: DUF6123 family protein [Bacillus sp. (in: firmicutes)]